MKGPSTMQADGISRRVLLGGGIALAWASAGCSVTPPSLGSTDNASKKHLSVGATLEPATLDMTASDAASISQLLLYNVYETLVKIDSQGAIKPLLAKRWDVSGDQLTYTFELDAGLKFASGTPIDAQAVAKSMARMQASASPKIKAGLKSLKNVEARDARTVVFTLNEPSINWLYAMTGNAGMIIDPAATDLATTPMGSGPYQLGTWTKGDRITLNRNNSYWGTPGRFESVSFRYFTDPNAMVAAMLSDDLDIISNLQAPQTLSQFEDSSRFTVLDGYTTAEVTMGFNHTNPELAKLPVRQAINYAINRQQLLDTVWAGKGQLIGSMASPIEPYYTDLSKTYPYDPEKAKALLAEAQVSGLSLRLRVPTTKYATDSARFVASQLGEVGITVTIEELDFNRWLSEVFTNADYDMTIVAHVEPRDIVQFANPNYYWRYNNTAFQDLVAKADTEAFDTYVTDMKAAAKMLADDAAADWLFLLPNLVIARNGITGISPNATSSSFDLTTIASRG